MSLVKKFFQGILITSLTSLLVSDAILDSSQQISHSQKTENISRSTRNYSALALGLTAVPYSICQIRKEREYKSN